MDDEDPPQPIRSPIEFPRFPMYLYKGVCGLLEPEGCYADGSVIFKEDFRGNLPTDPHYNSFAGAGFPPGLTDYKYYRDAPVHLDVSEDEYALIKRSDFRPITGPWY
jgi:hypothetical protein